METLRSLIYTLFMLPLMLAAGIPALAQEVRERVRVIEITGDVDPWMARHVQHALGEAAQARAGVVVLHINTDGGRADVATEVRDAVLAAPMPVIAYIDGRAIGAGALIALAADKIAMAPGGSIGAAMPADGAGGGSDSEKAMGAMREELRATAERNHREPIIAEAMADPSIRIPNEALRHGGRLLTLNADDARSAGYCDVVAPTLAGALGELGYEQPRIEQTTVGWSQGAVHILTLPVVSAILIMLGLGGIIYTIKTTHLSPIGVIGVVAIGLFFGAQYMVDLASYVEVLMFIAGIVLLMLEIFVIPGFGAAGILGTILVVASLFLSLVNGFSYDAIVVPLYTLAAAFVGLTIMVALMIRYLPASNTFNRFALDAALPSGADAVSTSYQALAGIEGAAVTTLRPAGLAQLGGERYDVITEGEFIAAGEQVRVVRVEGRKIIVRRA